MKVKIKKLHPDAVTPSYAKPGDAGMDLIATSKEFDKDGNMVYGTGLAFEIPNGFVGLVFPRSSNSKKHLTLTNSVGVLDSGYRGEVFFKFKPLAHFSQTDDGDLAPFSDYDLGDRVGQLIVIPYPPVEFEEVEELSSTERDEGGFGSTGV